MQTCRDGHESRELIAGAFYACVRAATKGIPPQLVDVWMISYGCTSGDTAGFQRIASEGDNSPTWQLAQKLLIEQFFGDAMQQVHADTVRKLHEAEADLDRLPLPYMPWKT